VARAREALSACGIDRLANRGLASLSGGERQRVALARALAIRPSLLLLDEPFASLDVRTKARLLDEVRLLARGHGITLVVVSHDRREVEALCVQCAVLEEGRLLEAGSLDELARRSRSDFARAFFRS
jgi:ABC-type sulfate/molybdate transport systems ATPase subunit